MNNEREEKFGTNLESAYRFIAALIDNDSYKGRIFIGEQLARCLDAMDDCMPWED